MHIIKYAYSIMYMWWVSLDELKKGVKVYPLEKLWRQDDETFFTFEQFFKTGDYAHI